MKPEHWAIYITNSSPVDAFVDSVLHNDPPDLLRVLSGQKGALFSQKAVDRFIEEEERHDLKLLNPGTSQHLRSFSSGERKKALLTFLLQQQPRYLILDNPFDNLDTAYREALKVKLEELANDTTMIQIISRPDDILPFIKRYAGLNTDGLQVLGSPPTKTEGEQSGFIGAIPPPLEIKTYSEPYLVQMKNVTVAYGDKVVVRNINWDIKPGDFWHLAGPNGSGKTTLLSLITGDNPKAYGQDIKLFGYQKGSGESVWDIKEEIGYFTPAMTDRFRGYHTIEHMLISGLVDSIGLYVKPSNRQKQLAHEWLALLGMAHKSQHTFASLSAGEKRLVMCARAMIKHPLLLILDEPTAGLDDPSAALLVALANKMASNSHSAIIFVSHRKEPGLSQEHTLELTPGPSGSSGVLRAKT